METPFVGREKEIAVLKEVFQQTIKTKKGCVVLISGDTGIGKTRLIRESSKLAEGMGYAILHSQCLDEKALPFLPIIEAFEGYFTKTTHVPKYSPLGLIPGEEEYFELTDLAREKIRMMEVIRARLGEITEMQPVLFILDDIHWADSSSLSLFIYLARNVNNLSIVLMCAYPDEHLKTTPNSYFEEILSQILAAEGVTLLHLSPLVEECTSKILSSILGTWKIPLELVQFVHEKTGGNPLFIEELGRAIKERQLFDVNTRTLTTRLEKIGLPTSMKAIIEFRIKLLNEEERKVLGAAAVIGRIFEYLTLKEVLSMEEGKLHQLLEKLVRLGFFERIPGSQETFRFLHTPVRDIVYSGLTTSRKRVLHRRAGEILEKRYGENVKLHGEIGTHYKIAGEIEKSVKYLMSVAEYSLKNFASKECLIYCNQILEVLERNNDDKVKRSALRKVYRMQGDCHILLGELKDAILYYEEALKYTERCEERAELYIKIGEPCHAIGHCEKALRLLEDAKKMMESVGSIEGLASALMSLGRVYHEMGDLEMAKNRFRECLEICQKLRNEKILGDCFYKMGRLYIDLGELDSGEAYLYRSLAIREKYNHKNGIADAYNALAIISHDMGEIERTLQYYEASRKIYEELGDLVGITRINNNLAVLHVQRGEIQKALALYQKNIEISQRTGDLSIMMYAYRNIGWAYSFEKEFKKAIEFYEKALEIASKIGDKNNISQILNRIAEAYTNLEILDKAYWYAEESLKVAESIESKVNIGEAMWCLAEVHLASRNYGEAEKLLLKVIEIYRSLRNPSYVKDVEFTLGRLYAAMGRAEEAKKYFSSTLEFYRKMGAVGVVKIIEEELQKLDGNEGGKKKNCDTVGT